MSINLVTYSSLNDVRSVSSIKGVYVCKNFSISIKSLSFTKGKFVLSNRDVFVGGG